MSLFSRATRAVWIVGCLSSLLLGGCSGLTPVYSERGVVNGQLELGYAEPTNRLEQIVYHDLALRLGESRGGTGPQLSVAVVDLTRDTTLGRRDIPLDQREVRVDGDITLTDRDGKVRFNGRRSATAPYETTGQVLADEAARRNAAERAAHALADQIRLTLLSALASPAR